MELPTGAVRDLVLVADEERHIAKLGRESAQDFLGNEDLLLFRCPAADLRETGGAVELRDQEVLEGLDAKKALASGVLDDVIRRAVLFDGLDHQVRAELKAFFGRHLFPLSCWANEGADIVTKT